MKLSARIEGLREVEEGLHRVGLGIQDLRDVFNKLAAEGVSVAQHQAPRQTGRLAASLRPVVRRNYAAVTSYLPYAGPINYGWRKRHIKPSGFMQRASRVMAAHLERDTQVAVERLIDRGL